MALTNQQIENLIEEIQSGKTLEWVLETYGSSPEVREIYEVLRFFQAQSLDVKPSEEGLESALNQAIDWDDEETEVLPWYQWMNTWRWAMGGTLSLALLLLVFTPWLNSEESVLISSQESNVEVVKLTARQAMPARFVENEAASEEELGMESLIDQLEAEFDDEFVEYQNLKEDYMPLTEEKVFSASLFKPGLIF